MALPYCSTAAEEGDHEHDRSDHDERPWCDRNVTFKLALEGSPVE